MEDCQLSSTLKTLLSVCSRNISELQGNEKHGFPSGILAFFGLQPEHPQVCTGGLSPLLTSAPPFRLPASPFPLSWPTFPLSRNHAHSHVWVSACEELIL